ncbi:MAG: M14 family metallopeptidase [Nitrococcus sp.]|nr:M14 family metallopeptidase [Nitrococcus sp.]
MAENEALTNLEALSEGFRQRYLDYAALSRQLQSWARAYPDLAQLDSLGQTPEGRELWLLTLGPEPANRRPAVWVDGNLHAIELAGSSVALAIAEDVLRLHLAADEALHRLPQAVRNSISTVQFHIMPRISPDGAEAVLVGGRYVRSVPRLDQPLIAAHWRTADVNGDGLALTMRQEDPAGDFVESTAVPGLMLPRELGDEGPFYRIYPEGYIEGFDGQRIPVPDLLSDNAPDLNRNFPHGWAPEHQQSGAGPYPTSEPESRAVVEFAVRHPNLFAWLNLHTFGGVFIRPLSDATDDKMDQSDLLLFHQVAAWAEERTGYPTVNGYQEFTYEPGKPLHGDLTDFAYHHRGCLAMVCELWDLFARLGIERKVPFVDHYTHLTREQLIELAHWDARHNASRMLQPWTRVSHSQLGAVEVGGLDPRVGIANPPYEMLPEICSALSALWLCVAALAPRLSIERFEAIALGGNLYRAHLTIANHGYLPTYILASARRLPWNEPLYAELATSGCTLVDEHEWRQPVGHLGGWGRGLFGAATVVPYPRSQGDAPRGSVTWTLHGPGHATVQVGSCRAGWLTAQVKVG